MVDQSDIEAEEMIRSIVSDQVSRDIMGSGAFPDPIDKDSLLKFMRGVVDETDDKKMSKTANFRDEEVGKPKVPVLTYHHIAGYAKSEGYDLVSSYLLGKSGGVATVSLGRRAKLLETLFTVRREMKNLGTPKTTIKRSLFGGSTEVREGEST